jgi:PAS domain S-box-containing protein
MEETDIIAALRAEIAELQAGNAELTRALSDSRQEVERLRQILESVPALVWETEGVPGTPGVRFTYVNERSEQILGYSRQEWFKTANFGLSIMHPEDRETFQAHASPPRDGVAPNHRLIAKDGREVWLELHLVLRRDATGAVVGASGVSLDVTERVRAEKARAELLERTKALMERLDSIVASVPGAVWEGRGRAGSPEHQVMFMSDYITTMLGYLPSEVLNDKLFWMHVCHPADRERISREIQALYAGGTGSLRYRWIAKDGHVVWIESTLHVIRDDAGMPVGAYGVTMDITARQLAEEEQARLREEVIRAQAAALEELSTPLIPISAEVLVMPLIGAVDRARAERVIEALLQGINRARARFAIIDITGVRSVDVQTADALLRAARAVRLLGAEVVLTGIRPEVAQTFVALGAELGGIATCGNLESGIAYASRRR